MPKSKEVLSFTSRIDPDSEVETKPDKKPKSADSSNDDYMFQIGKIRYVVSETSLVKSCLLHYKYNQRQGKKNSHLDPFFPFPRNNCSQHMNQMNDNSRT
uniref:Uncharacterized protein n=1 Tax=Kryptolebias marmoratus TaxID=37003 RepID=A0A3Q3F1I5_KRYMA